MIDFKDLIGEQMGEATRRRGRPRMVPREEQRIAVEVLSGYGVPQAAIADLVGVDPKTLRDRFRAELDRGAAVANLRVAQNMFKIATGDGREAVSAAKYWLSCRAGWSESAAPRHPDAPAAAVGKKGAAALAAETAEQGTGWADLVH
jgi:hypothetical protein